MDRTAIAKMIVNDIKFDKIICFQKDKFTITMEESPWKINAILEYIIKLTSSTYNIDTGDNLLTKKPWLTMNELTWDKNGNKSKVFSERQRLYIDKVSRYGLLSSTTSIPNINQIISLPSEFIQFFMFFPETIIDLEYSFKGYSFKWRLSENTFRVVREPMHYQFDSLEEMVDISTTKDADYIRSLIQYGKFI